MTITLELPPGLEGQLQQAARSQGIDISTFLLESARQRMRHDVLTGTETELLQTINAPIAPEERQQRDALLALKTHRELSADEHSELLRLIDAVEVANARRWQCVAELARRRDLSLDQITAELEIPIF